MRVAIVPFRDREPQLTVLLPKLLAHRFDRVVVIEQAPGLPFNRGLVKNAGFAAAPEPRDDDTVYFHDVDLLPGPGWAGYPAVDDNRIVHLYGHPHCLGGIVGMKGSTFRSLGGFCNDQWDWGGEDRGLQDAAAAAGHPIDRSAFVARWTDDRAIRELDAAGQPLRGADAKLRFMDAMRRRRLKVVPVRRRYPPGLADLRNAVDRLELADVRSPAERWVVQPRKM